MICPSCYGPSRITKTLDTGTEVSRIHECMSAECDSVWTTDQKIRAGTLRANRRAVRRPTATNAISNSRPPPTTVANPSAASNSAGGVGGGLPGDRSDPVPVSDPSRQSSQDLPRAREIWTTYDWRRKYGVPWCDKYGGTAIGGDSEADEKLTTLLGGLSRSDRLAAQARAGAMFAEFLAEDGEPAKARHRWAFFVGRFPALRLPMAKAVTPAPLRALPPSEGDVRR